MDSEVFSPTTKILNLHTMGPCPKGYVYTKVVNESKLVMGSEWPRQLAEMMIRDRVDAQFSLQLHKLLWPGAKEER